MPGCRKVLKEEERIVWTKKLTELNVLSDYCMIPIASRRPLCSQSFQHSQWLSALATLLLLKFHSESGGRGQDSISVSPCHLLPHLHAFFPLIQVLGSIRRVEASHRPPLWWMFLNY